MWRSRRTCAVTPDSCGAICGTRGMSNFLRRTPCARLRAGHRTLPPINQRPWPKRRSGIRQERRSAPRGNLRRRPGDGDDGVGEPAGSRGASPSLLTRGPLGAHTIERPSPPYFRSGTGPAGARAGTESQPACRKGHGSRVTDGPPWEVRETREATGSAGRGSGPRSQPVRRRRQGARVSEGFGRSRPGSWTQPACRRWPGKPGQRRELHTARQLAAPAR